VRPFSDIVLEHEGRLFSHKRCPTLAETLALALAPCLKAANVAAMALGVLHTIIDPTHAVQLRGWLAQGLGPAVIICLSTEVSPEIRE